MPEDVASVRNGNNAAPLFKSNMFLTLAERCGIFQSPTPNRIALDERRHSETASSQTIANDILRGGEAIAEFLYGSLAHRRKVYHLVEHKRIPHFRIGTTICARKSALLRWIERQEMSQ